MLIILLQSKLWSPKLALNTLEPLQQLPSHLHDDFRITSTTTTFDHHLIYATCDKNAHLRRLRMRRMVPSDLTQCHHCCQAITCMSIASQYARTQGLSTDSEWHVLAVGVTGTSFIRKSLHLRPLVVTHNIYMQCRRFAFIFNARPFFQINPLVGAVCSDRNWPISQQAGGRTILNTFAFALAVLIHIFLPSSVFSFPASL